jgi:hypothetical protein
MQKRDVSEWWFDAIASCAVLTGGAAFATLVYQAYVFAVPLAERMLSPRALTGIGW